MNEESGRNGEEEEPRGNRHGWKGNDAKCKNAK